MPEATSWLTGLSSTTSRCPRVDAGAVRGSGAGAPRAAPSTVVRVVWSWERCTGLLSRAAIPAARTSSGLSSTPEVSSTIGVVASTGSLLMPRATSIPSMSGMHRSRIASAYGDPSRAAARATTSADGPSSTTSTAMPQAPSCSDRISRLVWLSSTTSTRRPASRSCDGGGASAMSLARLIGTENQNVLPSPGWLSNPMVPPIAVTSCREMARPRPVPPNLRVVDESACEKASNRRSRVLRRRCRHRCR